MWFKNHLKNRRLKNRIRHLSEAQRREILDKSPFEAGFFQGTGFDVFRKDEPDFEKAYVYGLGHVMRDVAENWIIEQYLLATHDEVD
ncbi:hypothetical protein [Larkinella rosea]|uniref:Uncharacterized protein n=1 Tax=Larkinella rosea TaxID=2025312 RepID=A0A3P1C1Z1_9BACT|nr:hypothetical protein [Larkinella rosea]RRB07259.1 hypothetical protein EHT25_05640 [Larkinella rosea]